MLVEQLGLGDRVVIKRRLGMLEEGSTGVVLDIDSQGCMTIKMTRRPGAVKSEYVIVVNDIEVLEKNNHAV